MCCARVFLFESDLPHGGLLLHPLPCCLSHRFCCLSSLSPPGHKRETLLNALEWSSIGLAYPSRELPRFPPSFFPLRLYPLSPIHAPQLHLLPILLAYLLRVLCSMRTGGDGLLPLLKMSNSADASISRTTRARASDPVSLGERRGRWSASGGLEKSLEQDLRVSSSLTSQHRLLQYTIAHCIS